MISFEMPDAIRSELERARRIAFDMMRPSSRYFDDHEHEIPWDYADAAWKFGIESEARDSLRARGTGIGPGPATMTLVHLVEQLSWGDAGMYLCTPGSALGGAALEASGTTAQKEQFLSRFREGRPKWAAMAMTEPQCGSDAAAIKTRAMREGDEWVLNGEKIFVTDGHKSLIDSDGFVVVWATVDPGAGRAGVRPFVVEAGTPGLAVVKLESKMGIRASDTASLVLDNCRIPLQNLLGPESPALQGSGFKGALATFDRTRPTVAASAIGIARAAVDLLIDLLAQEGISVPYDRPRTRLSALQRDVLEMEAQVRAAWLLTLKAVWVIGRGRPCTLEASMCKIKAGEVVTRVTQKAVELMGPLGYSRNLMFEKWMRDAKINDLFEGTGQINRLVVARKILGFSSRELK